MKIVGLIGSICGLVLTILPPALFAAGVMSDPWMKGLMLAGVFVWFVSWPVTMRLLRN